MKRTPPGKLSRHDLKNTAKDALTVAVAVILTELVKAFTDLEIQDVDALIYGLASILAILFRKFFTTTTEE